ncbi:MAG: thiamine-phosphate kinase [Magnetovibrionaceae bacterium]
MKPSSGEDTPNRNEDQTRLGEFDMIRRFFAPLAAEMEGAFSLTDDAGRLPDVRDGWERVVTSDCLIAGVHFPLDAQPGEIASKAMGTNLSDLAAMGARPVAYTLALALPKTIHDRTAFLQGLTDQLKRDQKGSGIALLGGDTVLTPGPCAITITAFGDVPKGTMLRRSGAKPGDQLYVSGTIGDGALGLLAAEGHLRDADPETEDELLRRYHAPTARLALGEALRGRASAALDISDGLMADCGHLAKASGVQLVIDPGLVPLSGPARRVIEKDRHLFDLVLTGGDDYELAFTSPEHLPSELGNTRISRIGEALAGEGVRLTSGTEPSRAGYSHF